MRVKILFFSAWAFGQSGTPGTFKFIEQLRRLYTVRMVAQPPGEKTVYRDRHVPLLPLGRAPDREELDRIAPAVRQFAPDIIYVFLSPDWPQVVARLKQVVPKARVILDIKTPLLQQDPGRRKSIQRQGDRALELVDRVVTLAGSSAETWFGHGLSTEPLVYPLATDVEAIPQRRLGQRGGKRPRHWVLASSLHPKRKVSVLLEGFAQFLRNNPGAAMLHVYGDGPDRPSLEQRARYLGVDSFVRFHGLVPQSELHEALASHDGGIAWVPNEIYNDSPSLKALEYAAAGLPVLATATRAHLQMREEGFQFEYCDDDANGLAEGMVRLLECGEDSEAAICNGEAAQKRGFARVVQDYIVPVIEGLGRGVGDGEPPVVPGRSGRNAQSDQSLPVHGERPVRMMFIIRSLAGGKGGAERVASELACEMADRGHVVYLGYEDRGDPAYSVRDDVILVPFKDREDLRATLAGADLDVVTVFYFNRGNLVLYAALAEALGIPLVAQECTNPDRLRFRNWGLGKLSRARANWERELATSAAARLRLVMPGYAASFAGFQQPQIRAMPNGCSPGTVPARPDHSPDGRWRILMLNGFKQNKNLPDAVAAFARLAPQYPDWVLRVVGKEPRWHAPHAKQVADILDEHGLWERVEIAEPTEDVEVEFAAAHIHLIASLSEGCPTVVLEAMAAGLPSVGFEDCPGTNDLIKHELNGLLATAEDRVTGLARTLECLMGDPARRRELGAQARQDAENFEPQHVYDQWEALLTEAAGYRDDPDRLFREQYAIDPERALHARRMRHRILEA